MNSLLIRKNCVCPNNNIHCVHYDLIDFTGKRQQKWTSDVYKHYKPAVIKRDADGEKVYTKGVLVYEFVCKQ